jgi:hypothetical protein
LLDAAPDDADVVMFSDQDDVWLPDKVRRAIDHLTPFGNRPTLYFSRLRLVDENLRPLGESQRWRRWPSFRSALVQNMAAGCTMAINRAGLPLARQYGNLSCVHFHDWWLYLVFCGVGQLAPDVNPTILYRQHQGNFLGTRAGLGRQLGRLRFLRKADWIEIMYRHARHFAELHGDRLPASDRRFLERYLARNCGSMLRLAFVPTRLQQTLVDEVLFRGLVLASIVTRSP